MLPTSSVARLREYQAMPSWLYEAGPHGLWIFLLLTVVLGGIAAFVTGRAIATTWRPLWQLPWYVLLLALGVRFLHFALFQEPLLAPSSLAVDYVLLLAVAALGHRLARVQQMSSQYQWLYEATGLTGWRRRSVAENPLQSTESA